MSSDIPFVTMVALAIRAGRRRRHLSQRAFAEAAGLSQSRVARLEKGMPSRLGDVTLALAMVGLKLSVVDEEGRRWTLDEALEFDVVGVVDRGGRRFPAHLPGDLDAAVPYYRRFRDERAGYRLRGPWTFWRDDRGEEWGRGGEEWVPAAKRGVPTAVAAARFDPPPLRG